MKVCFFIWAMTAAGAERVLSILANEWAAKGWEVTVLTMDGDQARCFYPLAEGVRLRHLGLLRQSGSLAAALANNLGRIRTLRRAIREARPDVLISFLDTANCMAIMATRGLDVPVVISERTDPSRRSLGRLWDLIRDLSYPRADVLVFQSRAVMDWFPPKVRARSVVIPNPVNRPPAAEPAAPRTGRQVLAMGRLTAIKGFPDLIAAFALVAADFPDWNLAIWGEGPDRAALERQVAGLSLAARISLPGVTRDPFGVLRAGDVFVLSSLAEGFPNAMVEAMACGVPVISTRFGGAAEDILEDGINGLLVPPRDPRALAAALAALMGGPELRARLGARAPAVLERYSVPRVLQLWEATVARAMARRRE